MALKKVFLMIAGVFVVIFAGLAVLTVIMVQNRQGLVRSQQVRYESFLRANELKFSSDELTRLARTYVVTGDGKYEKEYWDILDVRNGKKPRPDGRSIPLRALMQDLGFTAAEFAKLKEAEDNSNSLVTTETIAMNAVKGLFDDGTGKYTKKGSPDMEMARRIMHDVKYHSDKALIMKPIDEFFTMLDERTERAVKFYSGHGYLYLSLILGMVILALCMLLVSYLVIQRKVLRQMGGEPAFIADIARRISEGDLTVEFTSSGREETGVFAAMRTMAERLKGIVAAIKEASERVASGSEELSAGSEQITRTIAGQVGMSQQIATSSSEMSQTVVDIARNASNIASSATVAADTAKEGGSIVDKAVGEVKAIARTVSDSARTVGMLGDKSRQIGEIVGVIKDIADQTNLLALNAAIEAARAGEQGRGFAVVADEVRKLAERTARATSEIGGMIKGIQDEVEGAVDAMEAATRQVEVGVEYSTQAGDALGKIVRSVDDLHSMVQQIASATEQMSTVSDQINGDIESVASGTREMSSGSAQIAQSSSDLARLAGNLRNVVGQFTV
ncbi:MAG: methyl-accepting chemotaxis protein [Nitrospirales bacterium]|nr:methyl-accepting chemotaxis protein [Nitrospirales bacterium]